ncbi:shikimate dehydrogenase, partial [Acinetobacter bereziniae]|nr:shikimate dehydrogenase [Acinetobacter bereziniae]
TYIDILINATPLGMNTTDLLPLDKTHIRKAKLVAECIVSQEKTKLIEYAEPFAEIHLGKFMLEGQLSQILDLFLKDTL